MNFTDKTIKSLPIKAKYYDLREKSGHGFAIRIFPSGKKTWTFFYSFEGKKRRMTLGSYPLIGLADARQRHRDALSQLAHGKDPGQENHKKRLEAADAITIKDLIDEYLEKWAKPHKKSWKEDERILKLDVLPRWGRIKAKEITRRHVILLLEDIVKRGAPIGANHTFEIIRRMFNFAIERDLLQTTPCYLVKAPSKKNHKDRYLSENEIKLFWEALDKTNLHLSTKVALKLQLVTAQRKSEILSMERDEINFKSNSWDMPAPKTKMKKSSHYIPLSSLALELIKSLETTDQQWLFPSQAGNTPMQSRSLSKAINRIFKDKENLFDGIKKFTPHDLRRTAASHMSALGISRIVISKILNHSDRSVTAIYDRHSYDQEKRHALEAWANKLNEIIYGARAHNVIQIKK